MSCSGCRVLRKGCSDVCVLRPSIDWIDGAEAQGHATVFVAKFFGRAGLLSSLSSLPEPHRPPLFRSLLYEACGRAVNPTSGVVGLLWSGNWHQCEAAVETVLRGGVPRPTKELDCDADGLYELKVYGSAEEKGKTANKTFDLDLCLSSTRSSAPSDESGMTSEGSDGGSDDRFGFKQPRLMNLLV